MIADPARSRMLAYLLTGEYASAGELATAASVTPATASGHLSQLRNAGFVVCEPRGHLRDYRLADAEIALGAASLGRQTLAVPQPAAICSSAQRGGSGWPISDSSHRRPGAASVLPTAASMGPSAATISPAAWRRNCSSTSLPVAGCVAVTAATGR